MTNLAVDTLVRANQAAFGTASDAVNVWGAPVNGNGVASIASNRGIFGTANLDTQMICGSHGGTTDINMLVKLSTSDLNNVAGILWHYTAASGGSGYRAGFFAGNLFVIDKYTNGSRSNLLANTITSYSTNTDMVIRLIHLSDGTLQIRWWPDGQSEPANFNSPFVNQSETSFSSGDFGVSVFINSGGTVSYGSFTVTDNASGTLSLVTPGRATFKVCATRQTQARGAFKIRAGRQTQARATFKIRARLATETQATFKIHSVITALTTLAQATFKIATGATSAVISWVTRDNQASFRTRDNQADWKTRG